MLTDAFQDPGLQADGRPVASLELEDAVADLGMTLSIQPLVASTQEPVALLASYSAAGVPVMPERVLGRLVSAC